MTMARISHNPVGIDHAKMIIVKELLINVLLDVWMMKRLNFLLH